MSNMPKFIGQPCSSCKALIGKDDDIVVCPECGAPYHRECYKNEGKCVRTDLHSENKEWTPVFSKPKPENDVVKAAKLDEEDINGSEGVHSYQEEYNKNVCPVCKLENKENDIFCVRCGTPLDIEKATEQRNAFFTQRTVTPDSNVDGNTVEEYTRYIGSRFFYFIPQFLRFSKTKSKFSFNFSAFMFPNLYYFYRKMNLVGIIMLIVSTLISLPSFILISAEYGLLSDSILSNEAFILVNNICAFLSYVVSFGSGILANYIYYRKAKGDIDKIKETVLEEDRQKQEIAEKGGTSMVGLVAAITATVIISLAFTLIVAQIGL